MVAISLSVRALILTVVSFASVLTIEHPVEDYARIFKLSERDVIARRIASLTNLTDVQMAVLTVRSLNGQKIEVFSKREAKAWGGGGRDGKNNGLLLVIAPKEHRIRLEVGAGLVRKLPSDRVQTILDSASSMLKTQLYQTAVLDIINDVETTLRGRSPIFGAGAVAVGGLATAAAVKVATSGNKSAANASATNVQPVPRDATAQASPLPPVPQFADQTTVDSLLMKKAFLFFSFVSLVLGLVLGRSRMRQSPWSLESFFSYALMIAVALGVSWLASVILGSSGLSPAVLIVTLVQAFSGMRAALTTHLKRIVGPDSDFELVGSVIYNA